MQRTSIYFESADREALAVIKATHGIATDAGAVRYAVRQVAREAARLAETSDRASRQPERVPDANAFRERRAAAETDRG